MHPSPPSYAVCFLALLAACGGGGGGGGPVDVQFTSFSTIAPNQRANMNGISQTASGTGTSGAGGSFTVSSVAIPPPVDTVNSGARITFDSNRNISAMSFTTPQSSAAFSSGIDCSAGSVCAAETATSAGVLGNPSFPAHSWNYQTYGVWFNLPSPTTFQAGAISVGAATAGNAVPNTGSATFTGFTSGFYVNEMAVPHFLSANVSATVTWGSQSIAFSTNTTTIGNLNTGMVTADSQLDLTGTLTYAPGSNQFTSSTPLTAPRNLLTGSATGRFYGPAAQEMGGVYNLSGNGGSTLIGAFGARRPEAARCRRAGIALRRRGGWPAELRSGAAARLH